jgi:CBS domain-containing membrane protein
LLQSTLVRWLLSFAPAPVALKWPERVRACVGALIGIVLTGGLTQITVGEAGMIPLLVAPMGASAVLLFAVPASPLAQPWSIMGGNLASAVVGVTCAALIRDPVHAAALAVALAICAMFVLRCIHPPSGAVALTAVLGGSQVHALGYGFVLAPIALQSAALLGSAVVYHRLTGHRYPHAWRHAPPAAAEPAASPATPGFTRSDLEAVLARQSELLDIDPDDLEALLRETQLQAYARTFRELTCADIMSRGVITITPAATVDDALHLLTRHHIKALPVVDPMRRVVGIVTRVDLAGAEPARTFKPGLAAVGGRLPEQPENEPLVASVMTADVCTVEASTVVSELVPMFANFGHHHIPVVDAGGRVVGMITEADLIAGLYRQTNTAQRRSA